MPKTLIHTVNARGNIMLEVVRDHFSLSPQRMRAEIHGMLKRTVAILAAKDIQYNDLKKPSSRSQTGAKLRSSSTRRT